MESFPTKRTEKIEDAEVLFEGTTMKAMVAFCEEQEVVTSSGQPFRKAEIEAAFDLAFSSNFSNLNGFTSRHGLREAAAKILIQDAGSFAQLDMLLAHIESVTSDANKYTGAELQKLVQEVKTDGGLTLRIPSVHGLRQKVQELLHQN